jgi:hypothetical protein
MNLLLILIVLFSKIVALNKKEMNVNTNFIQKRCLFEIF